MNESDGRMVESGGFRGEPNEGGDLFFIEVDGEESEVILVRDVGN